MRAEIGSQPTKQEYPQEVGTYIRCLAFPGISAGVKPQQSVQIMEGPPDRQMPGKAPEMIVIKLLLLPYAISFRLLTLSNL